MVEASSSFHRYDEEVLPIQTFLLNEGQRISVHYRLEGRIIRGIVHYAELEGDGSAAISTGFEVSPVIDLNGNPMGEPRTISFDEIIGEKPDVVIF